jgi:tetratricopeptide (TPR) repeat protein
VEEQVSEAQSKLALLRLARDDGRLDDALFLVGEVVQAADAERDYEAGANALASVARIYMSREEFCEAIFWLNERLDYARGRKVQAHIAGGAHDLGVAYDDAGLRREALECYGCALEAYGNRARRLSGLIADMHRQGVKQLRAGAACFAVHAWKAFQHDACTGRDRLFAVCNLYESAAACSPAHLKNATVLMRGASGTVDGGEGAARALLGASQTALDQREHSDGYAFASKALSIATARGERIVSERAASLMDTARHTA